MGDKVAADFIYDPPAHNTRCNAPQPRCSTSILCEKTERTCPN